MPGISGDSKLPRVYIILVTWNNWVDTVECLESLLRLNYRNRAVLVVDNASTDGTPESIRDWASGVLEAPRPGNPLIGRLVAPPVPKPISVRIAEAGATEPRGAAADVGLTLLKAAHNLGFGAGNNVGIAYARERSDCDYVWLLNNDTVVEPDSLTHAIAYMRADPSIGICGSTILEYHDPHTVQARAGLQYDPWHARGVHIGAGEPDRPLDPASVRAIEASMDAVQGASMLVSSAFLNAVGPMPEQFFLYFEEMEWAARAKPRFRYGYAQASRVFHKEGGTVQYRRGSFAAHYYFTRNRLRFTRNRFARYTLPVYLHVLLVAFRRLLRGESDSARIMFRAIRDA